MNRLARGSGLAVSALTAATATILLLLPGRARLDYPGVTVSASGGAVVTSGATVLSGTGPRGLASATERVQGLTVSGTGSPSRLFGTGDGPAGRRSTGAQHARPVHAAPSRLVPVVPAHRTCSGLPGPTTNDYAVAYDTVSGHWSGKVPLDSGCASR